MTKATEITKNAALNFMEASHKLFKVAQTNPFSELTSHQHHSEILMPQTFVLASLTNLCDRCLYLLRLNFMKNQN